MNPYWSYILTSVGLLGLWMAGRKYSGGWAVGIGAQALWAAYAIATGQWGFLVSAGLYGFVYTRNFVAWRRDELAREHRAQDERIMKEAAEA